MVLAFLRAELRSPRFGESHVRPLLRGRTNLVSSPNLHDASENGERRNVLMRYRGFGSGKLLFTGFPSDVVWHSVALRRDDVAELRYADHPTWNCLSGNSRRVADGVLNVDRIECPENANENIRAVVRDLGRSQQYAPIIIVAEEPSGQHVIVEGHTRATAYCLALGATDEIEAIAGYSPRMKEWSLFCPSGVVA